MLFYTLPDPIVVALSPRYYSDFNSIFFPLAFFPSLSLSALVVVQKKGNKICETVSMSGKCISLNVYSSTLLISLPLSLSTQIKPFLCKLAGALLFRNKITVL